MAKCHVSSFPLPIAGKGAGNWVSPPGSFRRPSAAMGAWRAAPVWLGQSLTRFHCASQPDAAAHVLSDLFLVSRLQPCALSSPRCAFYSHALPDRYDVLPGGIRKSRAASAVAGGARGKRTVRPTDSPFRCPFRTGAGGELAAQLAVDIHAAWRAAGILLRHAAWNADRWTDPLCGRTRPPDRFDLWRACAWCAGGLCLGA